MTGTPLLDEVIRAHGGRARWQEVDAIEAGFSSGGLAFTLHGQPTRLRRLQVTVHPHARRVAFRDYCRPGWSGVWTPEHVWVEDAERGRVRERRAPRLEFRRPIKNLCWDTLDILYFAGYAMWNYLSFPILLDLPGVSVTEAAGREPGAPRRLLAHFEADVPTHSADQVFHIDAAGHLLRHDYTADVIGPWARAANLCQAATTVSGLRCYTRRKVLPRLGPNGIVLPVPPLVWIELDAVVVRPASARPKRP